MKRLIGSCLAGLVFVLVTQAGLAKKTEEEMIPSPMREFRAVWVATVANIDWPSEPGLTTDEQKAEAIAILDKCAELNLNAVVFQVRPQADALYASELEPWSYFLTGEQGKAPDPYYDPLEFWVAEAHKRGLELHAWFNPYRANHPSNKSELAENSLVKAHPEMVVQLGDKGYYWMDPALESVQDHSVAVCMDVVKRYDVDGIHFDDYFYPYASYNDNKDFPDDASWQAYQESGGKMSRGDWRRNAVNVFIKRLSKEIKKEKPHVKFGISPFGIWRPGYPESIRGLDQYDALYADAKLWFEEGWLDYLTPQLYWPIAQIPQSYPVLVGWWEDQNKKDRHLWPGLSIGRASREGGTVEVLNEIQVTRGMLPDDPGNVFFSMKALMRNAGELADKMADGPYKNAALVPPSPWIDKKAPAAPKVSTEWKDGALEITWMPQGKEEAFVWVVNTRRGERWDTAVVPGDQEGAMRESGETPITAVAVSAVDRNGNESKKTMVEVSAPAK